MQKYKIKIENDTFLFRGNILAKGKDAELSMARSTFENMASEPKFLERNKSDVIDLQKKYQDIAGLIKKVEGILHGLLIFPILPGGCKFLKE